MEAQWKEIRSAYKRILNHAFHDDHQRDAANIVLLKLAASLLDLSLSGDETLRNAAHAMFGEDFTRIFGSNGGSTTQTENHTSSQTFNTTSVPNVSNIPNIPNISNVGNIGSMFSFADELFQRAGNGHGAQTTSGSFITSDELRSLFPLWNMFDNDVAQRATSSQEQNHNSNDSNSSHPTD